MCKQIHLCGKTFELYIPEDRIASGIDRIADGIRRDMEGRDPLFVGILNGAYFFAAELMSRLPPACELTFAAFSSYRGLQSTGVVRETLPVRIDDAGKRPVVLLEDVIDSGLTMQYVINSLHEKGVEDVRLAAMLVKPDALRCDVKPDYTGIEIANDYIVGFGLDYNGRGRALRDIYKLKNN